MPAQMQSAMNRLTAAVKAFSLAQRTLAIIGVAVLVLGAVALSTWLSKPTMSPLFTSLSGADASAIVDELETAGVSYQLADGGSTVLVPADQLYGQRIKLAAAGLPTNADGGGYSLLDEMPMTSSEFQQQKTYQRALEGELAKTIGAIDGVDVATVRLAMPEDTVFVSEKADPTASVFVRTTTGVHLGADQVQSIVHLVSAGIEGMQPTDVAVIDSTGQVLSAVGSGTTGGGLAGRQTNEYEERVRGAVQALLDQVVGVGHSAVTVTAELDYDETQRTVEQFSASEGTPPLASSKTTEDYTGSGGAATGVLGPDNIAVPEDGSGSGTYTSTTEDVQNAVNKSTEVTKAAPGAVERQSVAVAVDTNAAAGIDMAGLSTMVAAAAGIDPERGDTIAVESMVFDTSQAEAAQEALAAADAEAEAAAGKSFIRQAAIGGAALLLAIIVVIVFARRSGKSRRTTLDLGEITLAPGPGDPLGIEGVADALPVLPAAPLPAAPDPVAVKRAEISALADEQPEEVADLLRGWLVGAGPAKGRGR
ncbi:flagellar basal-body MS-ring/collar protein FliF [Cellulomonas fengjieae]|uniref:flagellar basal-body MS-ring/collar protein FliF n=1 Tax=Cellulomonas fengjieae TaxID=2819978 RepID=UPI001AAF3C06|nr:flagellar basal-body MS-ring/collar protein FliF [Cellulomonas fengjieae]MBO3100687.1 flagellar M-ring protein FliF [Cellulomonas fengjieae]